MDEKHAALLFTTGLIWHGVTSCLIPVLQHIELQCLCESGDKCLHNSNANDSVDIKYIQRDELMGQKKYEARHKELSEEEQKSVSHSSFLITRSTSQYIHWFL